MLGQQRAGEEAALLGGRFSFEEKAGSHPYHPDEGVLFFEGIEHPLQVGILPAVSRLRPAVGGPGFVDEPVFRPGE